MIKGAVDFILAERKKQINPITPSKIDAVNPMCRKSKYGKDEPFFLIDINICQHGLNNADRINPDAATNAMVEPT